MELSEKKCISCEGGASPLAKDEISDLLAQIAGWELSDSRIERTFRFANFVAAMKFANRITDIAEAENHHPDLYISWGKVRVELSTHSIGGLSTNDFIVAAKINKLWDKEEHEQAI
jgi:4a-hydroxytetrahydrobiopterin dehydratase